MLYIYQVHPSESNAFLLSRHNRISSVYKELHADQKCGLLTKGLAPWHTTLLAKCSVLYALPALLRKWGCRWERQAQNWFRQQTGHIWKPSFHVRLWDKVSRTDSRTPQKADGFSSQNWTGRDCQRRRNMRRSS